MFNRNSCFAFVAGLALLGHAVVAQAELPDFTPLVESASPAVVNISTKQKVQSRGATAQMPELEGLPPIFREFFEHSIPQMPGAPGRGQQREAQSLGSGFIISEDGYVLTNNHVVADADEIIVRLPDRSELEAKLIGADPRSDVAVLKVEGKGLPTVKIGRSDELKAGEWVLAIGSPFGFDHTVTAGIVSATGRSLPNESYVPFIQTDVAINPGNSGGPLFNLDGEVIGINSQIFTRSGGFMGLSFAIPIDVAMDVANQLRTEGKVSRGWLGVVIQEVNKDLAESFGLERPAGALVAQVMDGGPAARGGLRVGDVILSLNDKPIVMSADLPHLVGALKPGSTARMEVVRDGDRKMLDVKIGAMPEEGEAVAASGGGQERSDNRLGVKVTELTDEQKKSLDLPGGVVITEILNGPAAMIGLRPGDVITHLNNQAINSAATFARVAEQLPKNRSVSMRVLRQGRASFITFKLAE
ncbi:MULTISPECIES: DegQ family serine endoprotease [Stutzerimonas stutzeri subgroup]|jgi:serine protease Do|uniref:DegQ family serine endoprotease n=2 Tax=Stutzerimonas stutzeri subgroup TaxID=578833 RepID=A0ACC5VEI2_STUCH|nr:MULTISPECIES: DegQ family serine endoprotease [Stutzerimonas stutzeri group]MAF86428.1 serine peptidase [Pseudomonas sp.]MBU0564876.1 DegQ family serine endoprotease [Gammaproteobacteria bacterium]MCB4793121.1 DegQ family serine endoprotease [Pseudomonas sp. NP21570]OHC14463.1 MAG: serine peptidase [Pseudomonadales bacterium GWC2_63_15]RRU72715.1 DegQ family serine endoprotease [Stutzerimonas xanthomarina]|tara:strand:- start:15641 stop:17056 length:1416 start_codon:yes stop_codon:yes gene_type:complete